MYKIILLLVYITVINGLVNKSVSNVHPNSRILSGTDADDGAYPFMVSLRRSSTDVHFCGGSVVGVTWILTSASCLNALSPEDFYIIVGTNTLDEGGVRYEPGELHPYTNYTGSAYTHNIALIKVTSTISFTNGVSEIGLVYDEVSVTSATVIGWGRRETGGEISNNLQELSILTIGQSLCQEYWGVIITDYHVCTIPIEGRGTCNYDGGGPLLVNSKYQLGIVSFTLPCGMGVPDVYTKVSAYIDWIYEIVFYS